MSSCPNAATAAEKRTSVGDLVDGRLFERGVIGKLDQRLTLSPGSL